MTETLRVCLLAPEFLPVRGGVGTYSVALVRELSRIADVTVLTLTRSQGAVIYRRAEMEDAVDHRARVFPIAEARDTFLYNAKFQIELLRRLPALARAERFDIVHSQHAHMPDLLAGPMTSGVPIVRTIHSTIAGQREAIRILESLGQTPDVTERWQVAIEPVLRAAEWSTLHRPGLLFPVCEYTGNHLVELGIRRDRIRVIHNGIDTERFRPDRAAPSGPGAESGRPRVLFVGRFTLVKGIGTLVGAIPRIVREIPSVRFQFTGRVPAQLDTSFSLSPELRSHLEFLGYVPDESLPALYASATVAVAPSLYDSFPFSVLEAMASGTPLVASRVGGIPEALTGEDDGILVDPGNSDMLADSLIALLGDPERRRRMGARARTRVMTHFTWPGTARATNDGYREALATAAGPRGTL
ncbi:MAG: glycosyltransferase family 4 protein [Thermoplasmata archaeon]